MRSPRRRRRRDADVEALRVALAAGSIDAVAFTSSSTVTNFADLLGAATLRALVRDGRPAIACIGPVTADTARALGLAVAVVPERYTAAALADAIDAALARR